VKRDNRCDLVGYDIEEPITDGPSDFHCHVTLSSALPLDVDSLVVRSGRMDLFDRAKHLLGSANMIRAPKADLITVKALSAPRAKRVRGRRLPEATGRKMSAGSSTIGPTARW
jgi:hypothetical protein